MSVASCGLLGCKSRPTPFPGRMSYKATKPGLGHEGIISVKPRPKTAYDCVGLLYSFVVILHAICDKFPTSMA